MKIACSVTVHKMQETSVEDYRVIHTFSWQYIDWLFSREINESSFILEMKCANTSMEEDKTLNNWYEAPKDTINLCSVKPNQ